MTLTARSLSSKLRSASSSPESVSTTRCGSAIGCLAPRMPWRDSASACGAVVGAADGACAHPMAPTTKTAAMTTILIARLYRYSTRRNTRKMPPATLGSSPTKVAPTARAARSPRIRWPATPLLWRCRAGATRAPPNAHRAARAPHRAPAADRGDHVVARPAARELEHARHLLVLAREPRVGVGE